jgi:hypothetical protein
MTSADSAVRASTHSLIQTSDAAFRAGKAGLILNLGFGGKADHSDVQKHFSEPRVIKVVGSFC